MEGLKHKERVEKMRKGVLPAWQLGCLVWPAANTVNFTVIPPTSRLLWANIVGLVWNSLLSYCNQSTATSPPAARAR